MVSKFLSVLENFYVEKIYTTGSNRYCLDKNYAGVLIIWDRMFGTFEWERADEKIVYGLVDQPQFFNPLKHQVSEQLYLLLFFVTSWMNFLS